MHARRAAPLLLLAMLLAGCLSPDASPDAMDSSTQDTARPDDLPPGLIAGGRDLGEHRVPPEFSGAYGVRDTHKAPLTRILIDLVMPPDAAPISLADVGIRYTDDNQRIGYTLNGQHPLQVRVTHDLDGNAATLSAGEAVELEFRLSAALQPSTRMRLDLFLAEHHLNVQRYSPAAYYGRLIIPLQEDDPGPAKQLATQEVSSNLKIVGVYGVRNDTSADLHRIKVNTELSAGAPQLDLTQLMIRYSDGQSTYNYGWKDFQATWIRGDGAHHVMEPGDLVELRFDLSTALAERAEVEVLLIPETGTPVAANFKTPPTYGDSTTVTLR